MTAIKVTASVNRNRKPAMASQASPDAPERNPSRRATSTTSTSEIRLEDTEVSTCAHSTLDRAIGMDWKSLEDPALHIGEVPECGEGDAHRDRDEQDSRQQVVHIVTGAVWIAPPNT